MNGLSLRKFKEYNPSLKILSIEDKGNDLLIHAQENENEIIYGGFFLVNKRTGEWTSCNPIDFL